MLKNPIFFNLSAIYIGDIEKNRILESTIEESREAASQPPPTHSHSLPEGVSQLNRKIEKDTIYEHKGVLTWKI